LVDGRVQDELQEDANFNDIQLLIDNRDDIDFNGVIISYWLYSFCEGTVINASMTSEGDYVIFESKEPYMISIKLSNGKKYEQDTLATTFLDIPA
jgi:hypothetical protein